MDCSCKPKKKLLCLKILISILIFLVLIFLIFSLNKENKSILTAIAVEGDNTQLGTTTIKLEYIKYLISYLELKKVEEVLILTLH